MRSCAGGCSRSCFNTSYDFFFDISFNILARMPLPSSEFDDATTAVDAHGYDRPSKSQRKRDMTALQKLGEELVDQPRDRLERVTMPDSLRDAIYQAQRINSHEGRRRQLQFIGKLMRDVETEPIRQALDAWNGASGAETALLHSLERWRNRLLEDDRALDVLSAHHSAALNPVTMQQLRTHIRQARREQAEGRPPKHYRELFQVLKAIIADASFRPSGDSDDVETNTDAD